MRGQFSLGICLACLRRGLSSLDVEISERGVSLLGVSSWGGGSSPNVELEPEKFSLQTELVEGESNNEKRLSLLVLNLSLAN